MRHHTTPLSQPVFSEPVFNEGSFAPDPSHQATPHPSDAELYRELGNALKKNVVGFDRSWIKDDAVFPLADALGSRGPDVIAAIQQTKQVTFHVIGDSGASNDGKYQHELHVADQLVADWLVSPVAARPAFLYSLGDVVYDFGEPQYYYDQFYEPYRNYPAPIFAIPGNHDSFIVPGTAPDNEPLKVFARNFCAQQHEITAEAGSLHRTAMTQPGVYFALDVPFVRIIGLFSNALEDPGLISDQNGHWPGVPRYQLDFLKAQLARIKTEKYSGAVLLAMHHPPFTFSPAAGGKGGNHTGSTDMLREIDKICAEVGVYPHAVLSGHAHNYQRYTRVVQLGAENHEVPFVVCGCGGHNVNVLAKASLEPAFGVRVDHLDPKPAVKTGGLTLEKYDDRNYGYLKIAVDHKTLRIAFHHVDETSLTQSRYDLVSIDLATHRKVAN
jgi:hypothetical protein